MIAVIGVLVGMLLPALQSVRSAARRTHCSSNLRQIGIGILAFHEVNKHLPVGCTDKRPFGTTEKRQLAWNLFLLPYIEQQAVYNNFDLKLPFDHDQNFDAASTVVPVYLCPTTSTFGSGRTPTRTDDGLGATDYGGLFGSQVTSPPMNGAMVFDKRIRLAELKDGASRTIVIAEDTGRGSDTDGQWANGQNIFDQGNRINLHQHNEMWSDHPDGVQALFGDGSVHFLTEQIDVDTLKALCTRANGDTVGEAY